MEVTATEAKNRFGKMLDEAQRQPVFIEKQGRRHGVLLSIAQYEALLAEAQAPQRGAPDAARAFYEQHKEWVDEQNEHVAKYGIFGEEFRAW